MGWRRGAVAPADEGRSAPGRRAACLLSSSTARVTQVGCLRSSASTAVCARALVGFCLQVMQKDMPMYLLVALLSHPLTAQRLPLMPV